MSEHEEQARAAERELADMEERSERVGEQIDEARADWKAKQADDAVPGATGEPDDGRRRAAAAGPARDRLERDAQRRDADRARLAGDRADPAAPGWWAASSATASSACGLGHDGDEAAAHVEDLPHLGLGDARRARARASKTGGTGQRRPRSRSRRRSLRRSRFTQPAAGDVGEAVDRRRPERSSSSAART